MAELTADDLFAAASQPSWLATLAGNAIKLGLLTTSWRDGDPERVILTALSFALQYTDAIASGMNQGGFLDFAATGTVTFDQPDGSSIIAPVSPDPSDPDVNPNGDTTYLDELCRQNYDVERIRFGFAGGPEAILNTSASTYGPFDVGGFHVSNPNTAATYSNVAALTIAPSTLAGTSIISVDDNGGGLIEVTTLAAHGLATGDAVWILGVTGTLEANGAWYATVTSSTTFTLDGSLFVNPFVPGSGLVYEPTVATFTADVGGSVSSSYNADGLLDVHTVTQAVTSLVGVSVDNLDIFAGSDTEGNVALAARTKLKLQSVSVNGPRGAYEFFGLSSVTYAPKLNPPLKMGTTNTRVRAIDDKATGHVFTFIANASGAPSVQDVATTNAVIQAYCVPMGITAFTMAATEVTAAPVLEVFLPAAYATPANKVLFQSAVQRYVRELKIGGLSDPGSAYTNVLPKNDLIGLIYETARSGNIIVDNVLGTFGMAGDGNGNLPLPMSTSLASVAVLLPAVPVINLNPT